MTTATVIVNDALALLNLYSDVLPADPAHQQRGFTSLVSMLHRMRGDGMLVVNQMPASILSDLKEPSWATDGLKFELASAVAPFLRAALTQEQEMYRQKAMQTLMNNAAPPVACSLPATLPRGSGNWEYQDDSFYSGAVSFEYDIYDQRFKGESSTYYADFDYDATVRGTTVSSVAWSNQGSVSATISGASVSSNLATAVLAFPTAGTVIVRARATYANSEIKDFTFRIEVNDIA